MNSVGHSSSIPDPDVGPPGAIIVNAEPTIPDLQKEVAELKTKIYYMEKRWKYVNFVPDGDLIADNIHLRKVIEELNGTVGGKNRLLRSLEERLKDLSLTISNTDNDVAQARTETLSPKNAEAGDKVKQLLDRNERLEKENRRLNFQLEKIRELAGENKDTECIELKVLGQDNTLIQFRIKKHTPLQKLMTVYCERLRVPMATVKFCFDGEDIDETDTPLSLNLEDGDSIEAFFQPEG